MVTTNKAPDKTASKTGKKPETPVVKKGTDTKSAPDKTAGKKPDTKAPDKTAGKKPDTKTPDKTAGKKADTSGGKKGTEKAPSKAGSAKPPPLPELIKEIKVAATAKGDKKGEGPDIPLLLSGLQTAALGGKRADVLKTLDSITAVMKNHPKDAEIQHRSCGVIWALCCDDKDDGARKTVTKGTAIPMMLSALSIKDDVVLQHALGALGNVVVNNSDAKKSIGKSGATTAWKIVVDKGTTGSGPAAASIVEAGLALLKALANDGGKPDTKTDKAPPKAPPPILGTADMANLVKVLEKHASNAKIQTNGIGLMQNVAQSPAHVKAITAAGGAKVIKTANTKDSSALMSAICCGAIANLVVSGAESANEYAGSIEIIIKAMQANKKDELLQSEACRALCGLALQNRKNQAAIGSKGGIEAITAALGAHSQKTEVVHHGCAALVNICSNHNANKALVVNKSGGVKILATILQKHTKTTPDDVKIIREAAGALANLSGDSSLKDKINKEKVSDHLKKILKLHAKDKMITTHAELAIANLTGESGGSTGGNKDSSKGTKGGKETATGKAGTKEVTKAGGKETLAKGGTALKAGTTAVKGGSKDLKDVTKAGLTAGGKQSKETLAKGGTALKGVGDKATKAGLKAGKETLAKGDKALKAVEKKAPVDSKDKKGTTTTAKDTNAKGTKEAGTKKDIKPAKKHAPVVIPKPVKI